MTQQEIKAIQQEVALLKKEFQKYQEMFEADGQMTNMEAQQLYGLKLVIRQIEQKLRNPDAPVRVPVAPDKHLDHMMDPSSTPVKKKRPLQLPPNRKGNAMTKDFYDGKVGVKYGIAVFTNQPGNGGDADAFEFRAASNPVDVGHAFIGLAKLNKDGSKVMKTIGFYTTGAILPPFVTTWPGELRFDPQKIADVRATKLITHEQFFNALLYIEQNGSNTYDINHYNCAHFSIGVANAAGWKINPAPSFWFLGLGISPGGTGEELVKRHEGKRRKKPNPSSSSSSK